MNLVFGAEVPDNLQRSIALLGHLEALPTGNRAVLRTLENLLVQFFLFHDDPFLGFGRAKQLCIEYNFFIILLTSVLQINILIFDNDE